MVGRISKTWTLTAAIPILCAVLCAGGRSAEQEDPQSTPPESPVVVKKFRGRLPAYFSAVVTATQRKKVYDIQAGYHEKIEALEKQIAKLKEQQAKEIDAVLTPDQLAEVQQKRDAAAAKRKARTKKEPAVEESSD